MNPTASVVGDCPNEKPARLQCGHPARGMRLPCSGTHAVEVVRLIGHIANFWRLPSLLKLEPAYQVPEPKPEPRRTAATRVFSLGPFVSNRLQHFVIRGADHNLFRRNGRQARA